MRLLRPVLGVGLALWFAGHACAAAASAAEKDRPAVRSGARGPLPDPDLLDGSGQKEEKRADHGMLGEFEIPGADGQSDKVGGQQSDKPAGSGPQMDQTEDQKQAQGGAAAQADDKKKVVQDDSSGGGGGGQQQDKNAKGGGGGQQGGEKGQQGGGGQQGGQNQASNGGAGGAQDAAGQNGGAGGAPGANGPAGAQAGGIQVAQVSAGQAGAQAGGGVGGKPTQISLGDPSMQIKPPANAQGAVGAQVAGSTQQMEKAIGSGSGATGGASGGRGGGAVEKGATMPKGL
ncbi:MAG TPA: hypothetical protein VG838_10160 [Opitutaceae bacterium]|nr:hypothetical protein [Opitutaceae bacterium]